MSSRKLQAIISMQHKFINNLLDRLEGKTKASDDVERDDVERFYKIGTKKYSLYEIITLLDSGYFQGLNLEQIIELAKKSIRLTDDNCKMIHKLEDIKEILTEKDLCVNNGCDFCCNKCSNKIKDILEK